MHHVHPPRLTAALLGRLRLQVQRVAVHIWGAAAVLRRRHGLARRRVLPPALQRLRRRLLLVHLRGWLVGVLLLLHLGSWLVGALLLLLLIGGLARLPRLRGWLVGWRLPWRGLRLG